MKLYVSGIEIEIIRKNIKNMHLYVMRPNGKVRITVPSRLSEKRIMDFISSHIDWIIAKQKEILDEPRALPLNYVSGETLIAFGESYILETIESNRNGLSFLGSKAILSCKASATTERREEIVEKALREALYEKVAPLFEKWGAITGLHASSYQIKKMKTRWGTCNTRTKKIWLNLELAKKPVECIEYVILHELIHLCVSNHGKDFQALMDRYMPLWRDLRKKLNEKI